MKKLLLLPLVLTACSLVKGSEANRAEIMVKAQVPKATCLVAKIKATDIAICDVPEKDKIVSFLAVYGENGFKAVPLSPEEKAPQTPVAPPAPVATPDAGVGSASK